MIQVMLSYGICMSTKFKPAKKTQEYLVLHWGYSSPFTPIDAAGNGPCHIYLLGVLLGHRHAGPQKCLILLISLEEGNIYICIYIWKLTFNTLPTFILRFPVKTVYNLDCNWYRNSLHLCPYT